MKFLTKKANGFIAVVWLVSLIVSGANAQTTFTNTSLKNDSADKTAEINDANIAAIVSVAGSLDIAYGKIALSKSKNKMVLEFAGRMVKDHSAIQDAAVALLNKLGVTPEENETSKDLAENGEKVKAQLNSLKGKDFDKFYIDNEVSYHELVVNATDKILIANAKNTELKSTLESVLPLFKRHLEHAKMVQATFNQGKSKSTHSRHH